MASNVFANLKDIFGQQMSQTSGKLASLAGGVGSNRIPVAQANLAKEQGLTAGQTAANLYQTALTAAQNEKQREATAAYGFGQLAPTALNTNLAETGALGNAGAQQQALQQAELNAPYQNELARIAYQFQTPQYLAGIVGGLAPALGGTTEGTGTSSQTQPSPSGLSQALGIGTSLLGTVLGGPLGGSIGSAIGGGLGKGASAGGLGTLGGIGSAFGGIYKRGGKAESEGGAVNPYDFGEGFDDGGMVSFADRFAPATLFPQVTPVQPNETPYGALVNSMTAMQDRGYLAKPVGNYPTPPADPMNIGPIPPPQSAAPTAPMPIANNDLNVSNYQMPTSLAPYPPPSQNQNWGQRLANSPWMALVRAGAAMASTPGPIGTSIAAGFNAGANELESQRKAIRAEQSVNQAAERLYQNAKIHLDRYQRKTPHELTQEKLAEERLARTKFTPTNYIGSDGKYHVGIFNPLTGQILDPGTRQPVDATRLSGRNAGIETQNSLANQARVTAQADPEWVSDPLGTLNKYRMKAGLQPLGSVPQQTQTNTPGSSAAHPLPDPGEGNRVKGLWYIGPSGKPQQWLGNG